MEYQTLLKSMQKCLGYFKDVCDRISNFVPTLAKYCTFFNSFFWSK